MSTDTIRELLSKLRQELRQTELDEETRRLITDFDAEIDGLVTAHDDEDDDSESISERAQLLEVEFASNYPAVERVVREIVNTLSRMGV